MKNLLKISALAAAVLVASASFASAESIQLGSYATGGAALGNNNTAENYAGFNLAPIVMAGTSTSFFLNPGTTWIAALPNSTYVGAFSDAGPGGNNPASGYYTFTSTFSALSTTATYSGSLSIYADDTTEAFLNGVKIVSFGALGTNLHCADNTPNCSNLYTVNLSQTLLAVNTLTFVVQQAGDQAPRLDPSGFDYSGSLAAVPEPSTLLMLGTGLMGSAGALFRRMRS